MKPVVLFNFGYHRRGWIAPIEALKDSIEIVYLFFVSPGQEPQIYTEQKRIYWGDYDSIHQLLDQVKPDKIVSMSIDSGLGMLLNYAAKKRGIKTFILQHGIYSNYKDYREREKRTKKQKLASKTKHASTITSFNTSRFFKKSLRMKDWFSFLLLPVYSVFQKMHGIRFACRWVRFEARMPSGYICYSPHNANIFRELDNAPEEKILYIGNPEMDLFVADDVVLEIEYPYYLLIDQPLADNQYNEHIVSREDMIAHYLKLNEYCLRHNSRLKVKLHPESYHSDWLPKHTNIDWTKEHPHLPGLIRQAKGCFGYFSSLLIPVFFFNRLVLFRVSNSEMQRDAVAFGMVKLVDFFKYSIDDITFSPDHPDNRSAFIKKYVYLEDGNSFERLKNILVA